MVEALTTLENMQDPGTRGVDWMEVHTGVRAYTLHKRASNCAAPAGDRRVNRGQRSPVHTADNVQCSFMHTP